MSKETETKKVKKTRKVKAAKPAKAVKTREDNLETLAEIWLFSRTKNGKTREYMAKGLNISEKTVQNWENGVTAPDFIHAVEWFHVLGLNPLPYFLSYLFPDLFEEDRKGTDDDLVLESLLELIKSLSPTERRQLLYIMAGRHGSDFHSMLQMFTAHAHTSMQARVTAARNVLDNYEMEECNNNLILPEVAKPDIEVLKSAVEAGFNAVKNGEKGYTNIVHRNKDKKEE